MLRELLHQSHEKRDVLQQLTKRPSKEVMRVETACKAHVHVTVDYHVGSLWCFETRQGILAVASLGHCVPVHKKTT